MAHKLFENWMWNRALPAPFNDSSVSTRQNITSAYSGSARTKHSTLHAATLKALLRYAELSTATSKGASVTDLGAIGTQNGKIDIAEYPSTDGLTHIVVYNRQKGTLMAAKIDSPTSMNIKPYILKDSESSGSALIFALIPKALEDSEMNSAFADFLQHYENGFTELDKAAELAGLLCDNIYRRVSNAASIGENGIPVTVPNTFNIQLLSTMAFSQGTYAPSQVMLGDFTFMKPGTMKPKARKKITHDDFVGMYKQNERELSSKEENLIPALPSWYVIPPEVETVCKHIMQTTKTEQPMRNFLLRGPSGTGKTEGAKAIAAGLGLPYMHITCSANTEIFDLVGQILPDMDDKTVGEITLPTFDDIRMDPASAYFNMTGTYDDDATEDDVYNKLLEVIKSNSSENSGDQKQKFKYVETELITALKCGYLVEIQEPTVISNPGVLVGLNSLLDRCNAITLPTGERIERHPDTVIVVTTNVSYEGCKNLNQSIISRMNLVVDVDEPDTDTLTKRVLGITGCSDKDMVKKMAQTISDIVEKCRETMITDGSCGVRELISWVQSYMIIGDALEAAKYTVLSSVSGDPENREEIFSTCIEPIFVS